MKAIDLSKAKWLKMLLSLGYDKYQIENKETDTCTLTWMCIYSLGCLGANTIFIVFLIAVFVGVIGILISPLAIFTIYLPEGWQAPYEYITLGYILILPIAWIIFPLIIGIAKTCKGEMELVPKYLKGKPKPQQNKPKKKPSQTWLAIKQMWKSFKNKTCVKVKL